MRWPRRQDARAVCELGCNINRLLLPRQASAIERAERKAIPAVPVEDNQNLAACDYRRRVVDCNVVGSIGLAPEQLERRPSRAVVVADLVPGGVVVFNCCNSAAAAPSAMLSSMQHLVAFRYLYIFIIYIIYLCVCVCNANPSSVVESDA